MQNNWHFLQTFSGLFPLFVLEPVISRLLVDKSEKTRASGFLYTAVSVWLRLLPSGASGLFVTGEVGALLTGPELVAGEMLGAGCRTRAGTDMGSGTRTTGFGTLTEAGGSDFETDGGSGFGTLTGTCWTARGAGADLGMGAGCSGVVAVDTGAAVGMRTGASWGAGWAGDKGLGADTGAGLGTRAGERTGG